MRVTDEQVWAAVCAWRDAYEAEYRHSGSTLGNDEQAMRAALEAALSHAAGQDGEQCRAASEVPDAWLYEYEHDGESDHCLSRVRFLQSWVEAKRATEHPLYLRALSRGVPEGKIVAYRLHTPDNRWQWMDGTPPIGTLDLWKSYGWKLEYAYSGPDHAAIAAQRKEG